MDHSALQELYHRYARELYIYLYSLCRNGPMAEDLLQDVFLKALLSLESSHENLRAWLYLVGKNLCLNQMQRERRGAPLEEDLADKAPSILATFLTKERDQALYAAVLCLKEIPKQVIILQYFAGLSQREIGRILGLSEGNVRIVAHRAKRELKEKLEGYIHEV